MEIFLLEHHQIDKILWDKKINLAPNGNIYALTWYLDCVSPNWKALTTKDYRFIMPLTVKTKYLFSYLFHPSFTQQLGIFSESAINENICDFFIEKISTNFKYFEIDFNFANNLSLKYNFILRKNYLLNLSKPYEELCKNYSRSANRNILKAKNLGITIEEKEEYTTLIKLHKTRYGNLFASENNFLSLQKVFDNAIKLNCVYFLYAKNFEGKYIASSAYLKFKNKIIFMFNGNIKEGLEAGATHILKDYAIKKFSNQNLIMDFEGSDTPAFARFYEQYGATAQEYYAHLKMNNLPKIIRWLKK